MSGDHRMRGRGRMHRQWDGAKQTHNSRGATHSLSHTPNSTQYSNGWLPPGGGLKITVSNNSRERKASQDLGNITPHDRFNPRTNAVRSYSTSSVMPSPPMPLMTHQSVPQGHRFPGQQNRLPHGAGVKRTAPQDPGYAGPHNKMPRVNTTRSFSTSSVVMSSSVMTTSSPTARTNQTRSDSKNSIIPPKRTKSSSLAEKKRTSISTSEDNVKAHIHGEDDPGDKKQSQSESDTKATSNSHDKDVKQGEKKDSKPKGKTENDDTEESTNKEAGSSNSKTEKVDGVVNPAMSEQISRSIWSYYVQNKQTKVEQVKKEDLRVKLQMCIKEIYPHAVLILGGSSLNGFGSKGCDADLCLYLTNSQISQQESRQILVKLRGYLQYRCSDVSHLKVIFAKVPILKFRHRYSDLECDLNINHHTGIRNTALLQMYSKLDWRVAPLVMLIKQWAKNHGINDASQGTLSSYSYVLMIINYLQVGCNPPVLSSVQEEEWGRNMFSEYNSIYHFWTSLYNTGVPDFSNQSKNNQDLFSLLKGFFAYYANFNFESTVVSVRLGSCFPSTLLPAHHPGWRQKYIFIEEPYDQINTARSVFDWMRFRQILETFEETHETLCKTQDLDLDIFLNNT